MGRKKSLIYVLTFFTATASAQITGGGYGGTRSIPDLMYHLFGIRFDEPYYALGFAATIGVLWVATYVIFKVGIKKIDEGLDNDGVGESGIAGALGVAENSESRNVLAVLTLLIVLTMLGTGAFLDIIYGWQTLILLAFTISILAGLIFILVGGAGGIVGGAKVGRGLGKQVQAAGMEQLAEAESRIADAEEDIREAEEQAEREIDEDNEDEADADAEYTEEEIEQIITALEDAVQGLEAVTAEEIRDLGEAIENLEEIIELLETD